MTYKKLMSTSYNEVQACIVHHVLFRERAGAYYQVEKLEMSFSLNGFKISDTDQLTVALIFRFGVILV